MENDVIDISGQYKETFEQYRCFLEYVKMGHTRSLERLGIQVGKRTKTLAEWSRKYNWVERARIKDRELLDDGLESPRENADNKKLALSIINMMIKDCGVFDEKGNLIDTTLKVKSVYDIKLLLEMKDYILGIDKDKGKPQPSGTTIDKAIFILKK